MTMPASSAQKLLQETERNTFKDIRRSLVSFRIASLTKVDVCVVLMLAIMAGVVSLRGSSLVPNIVYNIHGDDLWFDADIEDYFNIMTNRLNVVHSNTHRHPLFSIMGYSAVYLTKSLFGTEPLTAVKLVIAGLASAWCATLFVLLRVIGCRRFDAVVFTLLGTCTASAMFWFVAPESFLFGSVTILLAMTLAAAAKHRPVSSPWYVAASVLTLSATVTNWMAGIIATIVNHSWKRSLQLTVNALVVVVLLWAVQKAIFPASLFFLQPANPGHYRLSSGEQLNVL